MLYCCKLNEIILTQFKLHESGLAQNTDNIKVHYKIDYFNYVADFLAFSVLFLHPYLIVLFAKAGTNDDL